MEKNSEELRNTAFIFGPEPGAGERPVADRRDAGANDRRTALRDRTWRSGEIWPNGAPICCVVSNLSKNGACLEIRHPVPDYFQMTFEDSLSRHWCRVVWRKENRIGVKFEP